MRWKTCPLAGSGHRAWAIITAQDGFKTFSHMRAVYRQPGLDVAGLAGFKPPYGKATAKTLAKELRK